VFNAATFYTILIRLCWIVIMVVRVSEWVIVTGVVTRASLVKQELPILPEHMSSPPAFNGVRVARSLAICVVFCGALFVLYHLAIVLSVRLSDGHCIVCPSVFWPLYCQSFCLFAIVLYVLLSFGHCIVCPSVFWPLYCLSCDIQLLITPLVFTHLSLLV
jgi:hypothetical protein